MIYASLLERSLDLGRLSTIRRQYPDPWLCACLLSVAAEISGLAHLIGLDAAELGWSRSPHWCLLPLGSVLGEEEDAALRQR